MTRVAFGLAFALGASVPAAAQVSERLPIENPGALNGVWTGTMGSEAIHACFDEANGQGVYYSLETMQLVRLINEDGAFFEVIGPTDRQPFEWRISTVGRDSLSAMRGTSGDRRRVTLQRVEWSAPDAYSGPCESAEFLDPRWAGGEVVRGSLELPDVGSFSQLRYVPPRHLRGSDDEFDQSTVMISTFAIAEEQPGDAAINAALAATLPTGTSEDGYAFCFSTQIAFRGTDGYWEQQVAPEFMTARWLGVRDSGSAYCGGTHPSHWQSLTVFDRESGEEIDARGWLNDAALEREIYENDGDSFVITRITDRFAAAIRRNWPDDADTDCRDIAAENRNWNFGLAPGGMAMLPELPYVIFACTETVVIPWSELTPFLSPAGEEAKRSLSVEP